MEDRGRTRFAEGVAVVAEYAEVVGGTARRRLPLVPRAVGADPVREVDPLADGPVLDDVRLDGPMQRRPGDCRVRVPRRKPLQHESAALLYHGHVQRRRRTMGCDGGWTET